MRNLFLWYEGRIARSTLWWAVLGTLVMFLALAAGADTLVGPSAKLILYPPLYWVLAVLAIKRYHDLDRSGWWLLLLLIPLAGPIIVGFDLAFRRGSVGRNRYGEDPTVSTLDYLTVD